jgi:hypothetical protein
MSDQEHLSVVTTTVNTVNQIPIAFATNVLGVQVVEVRIDKKGVEAAAWILRLDQSKARCYSC